MEKPVLVFDYDGTLHNIMMIYGPAIRLGLEHLHDKHGIDIPPVSEEQIKTWCGLNRVDMWNLFMPDLSDELKEETGMVISYHMANFVLTGKARWFDGIREQLKILRDDGYRMAVLSNCQRSYRDAHWRSFGMGDYFEEFYDCESFNYRPKEEIFKYIEKDMPGSHIIIGDRAGDMKCAAVNGLKSIGCLYGYGGMKELEHATVLVESPDEISQAVMQLS